MLLGSLALATREQDRSSERRSFLDQLFQTSRKAFPEVEALVYEASTSFNAQAFCIGSQKFVALFGGLAFNRRLGKDGLLFATLHEIGHHLAPGPRLTATSNLSCDCAADRWAVGQGQDVISSCGLALDIKSALEQIETAVSELGGALSVIADCLCSDWARRKAALTSPLPGPLNQCERISNLFGKT
ncbi:hypothetical protein [uncultured Bradyrhizobium sp.]|jgi:hypothetical protein|uniref:hypothetical protein n=1 Tax=uncultured Bradyrhizobium sp. TaxID=199684 RepID=UPI002622582B|nr:hypothetical protein [uncultured Bradyrhizobium sp.]